MLPVMDMKNLRLPYDAAGPYQAPRIVRMRTTEGRRPLLMVAQSCTAQTLRYREASGNQRASRSQDMPRTGC
jgi:hypothetical protein